MIRLLLIFSAIMLTACASPNSEAGKVSHVVKPDSVELPKESQIAGYWVVPDPKTKKPDCIVVSYEKNGIYYCRMVAVYDDYGNLTDTAKKCSQRAKAIKGSPLLCEFDMIWGLKFDGKKYTGGRIVDPDSGKVYDCDAWFSPSKDSLVIRGKLLIFGENVFWKRATELPDGAAVDLNSIVPNIVAK